ncbi:MAG: glycosyltransferase family 4 protein [Dorea sp.]|nr:glycosyltransferase family 4 protein [Dorea sp.]
MKICHLTSVHKADDVRIFEKECVSLKKAGYDVSLIAPGDSKEKESIHIIGIPQDKNRIKRILFSTYRVYKQALRTDSQIYHLHDPELLPCGYLLKKKGKKVIYDAHEDIGRQVLGKTWIPSVLRRIVSFLIEVIEKNISQKFDAVITVSPHISDRFSKKGIKTTVISNFPIITDKIQIGVGEEGRTDSICFAGGISEQWMHHNVIGCLEQCEVRYNLVGKGSGGYMEELKKEKGWERVNYLGVKPHEEVKKIYARSLAGMALNSYNANVGYKTGTLGNTKLFEYMEAGIPVICTDFKLWKKIIEEWECGICVNPYNQHEIIEAILTLKNDTEKAKKMGENGRKAAEEKYNWEMEEKKLIELYGQIELRV